MSTPTTVRDLSTEVPVAGQLHLPHLSARKADAMTTIASITDSSPALREARDQLLAREAQRADALARSMSEAETTHRYEVMDDLRATINEDRAEDLDVLLDLLSPCAECGAEMGASCVPTCQTQAHDGRTHLASLELA